MALNYQETGSNSSSAFVFVHGGAGAGWMWQAHIEQLTDFHSQFLDLSRHAQEGKKAGVVQVKKIKEWLDIARKAEPRKMEQCGNTTCLTTA